MNRKNNIKKNPLLESSFEDGFVSTVEPYLPQSRSDVLYALNKLKCPEGTFQNGKYSGVSYQQVIDDDPRYIKWLLSKCTGGSMEDDIQQILAILTVDM